MFYDKQIPIVDDEIKKAAGENKDEGKCENLTMGGDYYQISDSDSGLRFHTHGRFESSW